MGPADIFKAYAAALQRYRVPSVFLPEYDRYPETIATDVDHAVAPEALAEVLDLQDRLAESIGWVIAQRIQHQASAFHSVLINPAQPEHYLQLDVCTDYVAQGALLVPSAILLEQPGQYRGFPVPGPAGEAVYRMVRALVKRRALAPELLRLRSLPAPAAARARQILEHILGADPADLPGADTVGQVDEVWRTRLLRRNQLRGAARRQEWRRRLQRVRRPTGLSLAVLGSDGVGKSTVLAELERLLAPCFPARRRLHFAPAVGRRHTNTAVVDPQSQPPRSRWTSWLKLLYYTADHWVGFVTQVWPALVRRNVVLWDRHFIDVMVDPRRYRLQSAQGLARWLAAAIPQPHLWFVLDAPPATIQQRKRELSVAELARQREVLTKLALCLPRCSLITATAPAVAVARQVAGRTILALAARERTRAARANVGPPWRLLFAPPAPDEAPTDVTWVGIRRHGRPFLWLPQDRRLARRATALYGASSWKGRLLQTLAAQGLANQLGGLSRQTTVRLSTCDPFLKFLARTSGQAATPMPPMAVLAGNPNLAGRRHIILLFDATGQPSHVVKAGVGPAPGALLAREERFLKDVPAGTRGVPVLRTTYAGGDVHALVFDFQSGCPPTATNTNEIAGLLNAWVETGTEMVVAETPAWSRLATACSWHPRWPTLSGQLAHRPIRPAIFHGDFVPWNIRVNPGSADWVVLDWERGERHSLPGWDWLHYVVQSAILLRRANKTHLVGEVEQLLNLPAFRDYLQAVGLAGQARPMVLAYLLYHLEVIQPTEGRRETGALLHALWQKWEVA